MNDLRKAAVMVLSAWDKWKGGPFEREMEALREALAQPEQEPTSVKHMVSWIDYLKRFSDNGIHMKIPSGLSAGDCYCLAVELEQFINRTPVYTAPPKREWVGLTGEETQSLIPYLDPSGDYGYDNVVECVRAAEAKLKEKNGG